MLNWMRRCIDDEIRIDSSNIKIIEFPPNILFVETGAVYLWKIPILQSGGNRFALVPTIRKFRARSLAIVW